MQTLVSVPSRIVPVVGGDLALVIGISLTGLLATVVTAVAAPGWMDVLYAWAWL